MTFLGSACAVVVATCVLTACTSSDVDGGLLADDWETDVPFETARPSPVSQLVRLDGTISFSEGCVTLVPENAQPDNTTVFALVLPATPGLAWSSSTQQLRIDDLVIPDGASISIGLRRTSETTYYRGKDCGDKVILANSVGLL